MARPRGLVDRSQQLQQKTQSREGYNTRMAVLMCFIGKLVAEMGSGFLLEVLMEVPDDAELQMVVVGVGTTGFVAHTKVVAVLGKLEGSGVFCSAGDYTLLPGGSHVDMCCWRLCAREGGSLSLRLEA